MRIEILILVFLSLFLLFHALFDQPREESLPELTPTSNHSFQEAVQLGEPLELKD